MTEVIARQCSMSTPVGRMYLVAGERGLRGLYRRKQAVPLVQVIGDRNPDPVIRVLDQARRELKEYFDGTRRRFGVRLDLDGTPFQQRVWAELLRIPYGETRTYAEIAARIRNPRAVRAVGTANGRNPISIFIPCHRVIASGGGLGGYSGGLQMKVKLLALEKKGIA